MIRELNKHARRHLRLFVLVRGLIDGFCKQTAQALVARETEYEIDLVLLTPTTHFIAAKSRVAAQDDPHPRPTLSNLADDARDLAQAAGGGLDVGAPQPHSQQVLPAKDIQRQVTVFVIVAVNEAALLTAMQFHIGIVDIQDNFGGRRGVRFQEQIDQQLIHRIAPVGDLGVPAGGTVIGFQTLQGALAYERFCIDVHFAGH